MTDDPIVRQINDLAHEEEALWQQAGTGGGLEASAQERLEAIRVQLDQCYDLLAQRRARREYGLNPDDSEVRPADVVERYQQ